MNRDDVIRMAQEAAAQHGHTIKPTNEIVETLTSFAALVESALEEKFTHDMLEYGKALVLVEREECARVVERCTLRYEAAIAIRARGNS